MEASLQRLSVNGVDLAYVEAGSGEPVVLVHGSLSDVRSWFAQMDALAGRYRVIAISRRYHWPTDAPAAGDRYRIADHVADLAALIDALGIGPAHLIGSSYGAMTSLALAATRPGSARSLVLGEPPLLPWLNRSPEGTALLHAFMAGGWGAASEARSRGDTEGMVRSFIDGVIGPGTYDRMPPPARASMIDNAPEMAIEVQAPPDDYFASLECDDLRRVDVPVLLLDGEVSPRMFRLVQDALEPCLPNVERATIPGASHGMHTGNPQAYNAAVLGFLARNRARVPGTATG